MTRRLERFSIECRITKTNAITMANHNKRKQHNEPIGTRSKYTEPAPSAGKMRVTKSRFILACIWLVEFFKPITEGSKEKPKQFLRDYILSTLNWKLRAVSQLLDKHSWSVKTHAAHKHVSRLPWSKINMPAFESKAAWWLNNKDKLVMFRH